jgi:hypothetical protein
MSHRLACEYIAVAAERPWGSLAHFREKSAAARRRMITQSNNPAKVILDMRPVSGSVSG